MTTIKPATPLPWHLVKDTVAPYSGIYSTTRKQVTHENGATSDANAAYIAHACNAYPKLVEAVLEYRGDLLDSGKRSAVAELDALLRELGEVE